MLVYRMWDQAVVLDLVVDRLVVGQVEALDQVEGLVVSFRSSFLNQEWLLD